MCRTREVMGVNSCRTKTVKNSMGRALFVAISVLLQLAWIMGLVLLLNDYYYAVSLATSVLAFLVVLNLYGKQMTGPMKASWIIFILFFPVMGLCIYLMFGRPNCTRVMRRRFERLEKRTEGLLGDGEAVLAQVEQEDRGIANQLRYLAHRVGFPGGYNLADEYFNLTHPFGWWKDTGLKLTGDAVPSLTVMFLTMWNGVKETDGDFAPYFPSVPYQAREGGIVAPYADSPLDDERVGETVYLNMVKQAKDYVYIITPYLILDDELISELTLAAMRGVEVRIITPGIPDKKLVYQVTRSYYGCLVDRGVRIFEYTPGFCHAKMMLCDGETAAVGTINLDYRSLYLHFENGVFLSRCGAVEDIRADFLNTFDQCREVTEDYQGKKLTLWQTLLRLFAPLL